MDQPRISASSYSNTAPLVWSFLYGKEHGRAELILDNAPARSAELLAQDRVDAALVPVVAYQTLENVRLIRDVCVGTRQRIRSVCLITDGRELADVERVALDTSSMTSAILTKLVFREFMAREPEWLAAAPVVGAMLKSSDAALIIGDPALSASADRSIKVFDLAEQWKRHTGLGFVFAMWMTRKDDPGINFAAARDEGVAHIDEIAANYAGQTGLSRGEMAEYLRENISYSVDDAMSRGMNLYFDLASRHGLIRKNKPLEFID